MWNSAQYVEAEQNKYYERKKGRNYMFFFPLIIYIYIYIYIYKFEGTKLSENRENTDQQEQRMNKQVQTACRDVLQGVG